MTTEGQAVTGVGQIQGRISAATEDVFIYLDYFGYFFFKNLAGTFSQLLL